jgi:hypothetical protein
MHRFYFHLSDHTKIDDEKTEACRTIDDARTHACHIATELARVKRKESRGLFIRVTDQNGKEVFRTAVAKAWHEARV